MTRILGVGHDLTDIADTARQLEESGSQFMRLFSSREVRQARRKAAQKGDDIARHLAACWAGKEGVVKAWTEALGEADFPLDLDAFRWNDIEILSNSKGCPSVCLSQEYEHAVRSSLGLESDECKEVWKISLTHSRRLASSVVLLCSEPSSLYNRL